MTDLNLFAHDFRLPIRPMPLLAFAAACLILLSAVLLAGPVRGGRIALEDGPLEALQVIFYFAGFLICIWSFLGGRNRFAAAVWAILCFVFVGEETSWMQRVFDYSVPAVEQINGQGEFNFHNLTVFDSGRLLDENQRFSISVEALLNSQNIFRLAFFTYFFVLPITCLVPSIRKWLTRLGYVFGPPLSFLAVAWAMIGVTLVFTALNVEPVKFYISEVREAIYAATIFIYTLTLYATGRTAGAKSARPGTGIPPKSP